MFECRQAYIWLLILFFIMPASGFSFNDIDTAFVSSVSQMPAIDEARLKPDAAPIQKGYISGYIDILGYTETARINGENYSIGSPIVRGNAWVQESPSGVQDSFSYSISISNDTTTAYATLAAVIKWHTVYCDDKGCFINGRFTQTENFYDSEPIPLRPPVVSIPQLIVHEYNNPNRSVLETRLDDIITSFNVTNRNGSLIRHIQIGEVSYTEKGIPYANFTKQLPIWKHAGTGIYQQGTDIALENSNFTFKSRTPFDDVRINPNITVIREPPTSFSMLNVFMILTLFLGYFTCKLVRKI
jgi:hypothetical protein